MLREFSAAPIFAACIRRTLCCLASTATCLGSTNTTCGTRCGMCSEPGPVWGWVGVIWGLRVDAFQPWVGFPKGGMHWGGSGLGAGTGRPSAWTPQRAPWATLLTTRQVHTCLLIMPPTTPSPLCCTVDLVGLQAFCVLLPLHRQTPCPLPCSAAPTRRPRSRLWQVGLLAQPLPPRTPCPTTVRKHAAGGLQDNPQTTNLPLPSHPRPARTPAQHRPLPTLFSVAGP